MKAETRKEAEGRHGREQARQEGERRQAETLIDLASMWRRERLRGGWCWSREEKGDSEVRGVGRKWFSCRAGRWSVSFRTGVVGSQLVAWEAGDKNELQKPGARLCGSLPHGSSLSTRTRIL